MTAQGASSIADELVARLPASPDVYPQKLDLIGQTLLLIQFDLSAYRAASFLDDRILRADTRGAWVPIHVATDASHQVVNVRPLHFIFHTGHVGSTLVGRLLDETNDVLSLREPLPLRTLAEAHDSLSGFGSLLSDPQFELLLTTFLRLWGRGYGLTRTVVVKATSSAGRMAAPILSRSERSRAIYLNLDAEPYLATLLAGQNSASDLRGHAVERIRRLQSRITSQLAPLHTLSIGELAALSWAVETATQRETVTRFRDKVMAVDFDDFLGDVAAGMRAILAHFDVVADARYLAQVSRSPVLTRYSKAPEFAYSVELRAQVLRDSRERNREQIRKGMDWLDHLAQKDACVAQIVRAC